MSEKTEAELTSEGVDTRGWGPTDPDEEKILKGCGYVLNPQTGIYEGDGHPEVEQ